MVAPENNASPVVADQLLLGRYRLLHPLAQSGLTEVWEGHDDALARPVAIKLIRSSPSTDADFRQRFRREAVSAASLCHPNLVATFDTGEDEAVSFIVMELVAGRDLRDLLEERGNLSPPEAVAVAIQTAEALDHAHRAGLVHRTLKPANILLVGPSPDRENGGGLQLKVAGFGTAGPTDANGNGAQPGVASGRYLSPEQRGGARADSRSDVYALGAMLFEMLAGRGCTLPPPLRLRQVRAGISRRLETTVVKAMAVDPDDRYQSAGELRDALMGLDLEPDDAAAMTDPDPTPPGGVGTTSFGQTERPWLVPAALIVLVSVLLVSATLLFSGTDVAQDLLSLPGGGGGEPESPIEVERAVSFDPEGSDGQENESQADRAADGDPNTAWATDRYRTREFGGLKSGVGLRLDLVRPTRLGSLKVRSSTRDWSASVFVADRPGDRLDDWGTPVKTLDGIDGDASFDLGDAPAGAVLLWINRLGEGSRVEVAELELERRSK